MAFDRSIIDRFERGGELLRAAVAGLSPEQLRAYPVPGTWSIHEIVIHLMDSDGIGIDRMKRIIAEDLPLLLGYDETRYIQRLHPHFQSFGQAVALFDQNRRQFTAILHKLDDASFERPGIHNEVGKVLLGETLKKYVEHLDHHLAFIARKRAMVAIAPGPNSSAEADKKLLLEYERGVASVRRAIDGLTDAELQARPVEGKWSTQEVIIHLADADVVFAHRIKRILAEDRPRYNAWSENGFIANLAYAQQSAEDAVLLIEVTHRQMMRVFNAAPSGWLDRAGTHADRGEQTARKVLEYATWHIAHHLKFVEEKRARLGKPLVGQV